MRFVSGREDSNCDRYTQAHKYTCTHADRFALNTLPHAHIHMGTFGAELAPFILGTEMTPAVKPDKGLSRVEAKGPKWRLASIRVGNPC